MPIQESQWKVYHSIHSLFLKASQGLGAESDFERKSTWNSFSLQPYGWDAPDQGGQQ